MAFPGNDFSSRVNMALLGQACRSSVKHAGVTAPFLQELHAPSEGMQYL